MAGAAKFVRQQHSHVWPSSELGIFTSTSAALAGTAEPMQHQSWNNEPQAELYSMCIPWMLPRKVKCVYSQQEKVLILLNCCPPMHLMEIHVLVWAGILWVNSNVLGGVRGQADCILWFPHVMRGKWLVDCIWCLLSLSKENVIHRPVLGQWKITGAVRYCVFLQHTKRSNGFSAVHVLLYVYFYFSL